MANLVSSFSIRQQRFIVLSLLAANAAVIAVMAIIGQHLKPFTIVQFELAGSLSKSTLMIEAWKHNQVSGDVFFLLGFDYLFMLVYGFSLWFVCMQIFSRLRGKVAVLILLLAWLQPVAALLDAIENLALYRLMNGALNETWPLVARYCALPKFLITAIALLVWAFGSMVKQKK